MITAIIMSAIFSRQLRGPKLITPTSLPNQGLARRKPRSHATAHSDRTLATCSQERSSVAVTFGAAPGGIQGRKRRGRADSLYIHL